MKKGFKWTDISPPYCPEIKQICSEMKVKGFRTGKRSNSKI